MTAAIQDGAATDLGGCVVGVMKTATYAKTASGGSFSYPFVFGAAAAPAAPPTSSDAALDRAAISEAMAKAKTKVAACGQGVAAHGAVKIKATVAPDGSVSAASVEATPDVALGNCVLGVVKAAKFKPTQQGGSLSYPFVF